MAAPAEARKAVRSVGQADAPRAARRWACARAQAADPAAASGSGRSVPSRESTTETCIRVAQVSWIRAPAFLFLGCLAETKKASPLPAHVLVNLVHELLGGGEAAPSAPDDLTAIRGIGIATQNRLYKAGIKSHGQLARATPEDVRKILGKFAGGADVEDWIAQATELAKQTNA